MLKLRTAFTLLYAYFIFLVSSSRITLHLWKVLLFVLSLTILAKDLGQLQVCCLENYFFVERES